MITYEIYSGEWIDDIVVDVAELAKDEQELVVFTHNDVLVVAKPGDPPSWLKTVWEFEREKLSL